MEYAALGATGLTASRIGLGLGPSPDGATAKAVRRAADLGVTLFETPDDPAAEDLLGRALPGASDDDHTVLVLQAGPGILSDGAEAARARVTARLSRLRRAAADVLLVSDVPADAFMRPDLLDALAGLREEGLVRAVGASVLYTEQAMWAIVQGGIGVLEFPYNPLASMPGWGVFQPAAMKGVGLIVRETLGSGLFTGAYGPGMVFPPGDPRWRMPLELVEIRTRFARRTEFLRRPGERTQAQALLRYALDMPQIATALVGARTAAQVEESVGALSAPPLSPEDRNGIRAVLDDMAHRHF